MKPLGVAAALGLVCMLLTVLLAPETVTADPPGTRSNGDRTVTLELFTATWCPGCPYADAVADRLLRVIGPERLSVIQYHVSMTDPMRIDESDARWHMYGDPALPSLFLDGEFKSDSATSYEETFDRYLAFVQESLQVETPVSLELEYDIDGGSVTLNTSLRSSESLAGQNLFLRVVLFENILEASGKIYNYSVRAYNETSVDLVTSPTVRSVTFTLDVSWITENMGAAAFLQVDTDGGIYQSANVMFGEPPVVTISNPSGGTVSGDLTVEGNCTSGRTLSEVFLKIDDGLWVEVEGTSTWQHDVNTAELSDGSHTIYAMVYDIAGTYSEADILSVTVKNGKPVPPESLRVVANLSGALRLEWDAPTENVDGSPLEDLVGYNLYRRSEPGDEWTGINTHLILDTNYSDEDLGDGETYYYIMRAVNSQGIESDDSNEASGMTPKPEGDDYTFTVMLIVSVILIVVLLLILLGRRRREEEEEAPEPEEPKDGESHSR